MWFGLVVPAAMAAPSIAGLPAGGPRDCSLTEEDYAELRRDLRELRREAGRPIGVAAEGERCEKAILDLMRNDPFLPVELVPSSTLEVALSNHPDRCGAILSPPADGSGYTLAPVGACDGMVQAGSRSSFTLAYVTPVGASARVNKHIGAGMSLLFDVAVGMNQVEDAHATPDEILAENMFRGLTGFDFAKQRGLRGAYVGLRGGVEGSFVDQGSFDFQQGIVEFVLGRKWIAAHGFMLQVGGGIGAEIPLGEGPTPETLVPVAELRLGKANTR